MGSSSLGMLQDPRQCRNEAAKPLPPEHAVPLQQEGCVVQGVPRHQIALIAGVVAAGLGRLQVAQNDKDPAEQAFYPLLCIQGEPTMPCLE